MSNRPVYTINEKKPFYKTIGTEFEWNAGLSASQKKKNVEALHEAFLKDHPDAKVLEVSTKSDSELGRALSPFHLMKTIPTLKKDFPVENIFQASKVFTHGGPYVDLLGTTPLLAKRDERLKNSGRLAHYSLEGNQYPVNPDLLFYNWLYIQALKENPSLAREVVKYDAFTDIEFNPASGRNNQARACALYVSLVRNHLLDQTDTFEDFKKLFLIEDITQLEEQHKPAAALPKMEDYNRPALRRHIFSVGSWLEHPGIGKGEVIRKTKDSYLINFKVSGPRTIRKEFVETQCRPADPQ